MNVYGAICEFNPFHNGHKYFLEQMRILGATHIAVCMSGSFTQRGEPAVIGKYDRVRAALSNGADLVLELPVSFACAGAERFALGGVSILDSLGCVDTLSFGSESGDTAALINTARLLYSQDFSDSLRKHLSQGMTFASAREQAVKELCGESAAALLRDANNILGIEYIKALINTDSKIKPLAVKRRGSAHDSSIASGNIASASFIREGIYSGADISPYVPENTVGFLRSESIPEINRMKSIEGALLYRLRTMSVDDLSALPDISEGLHNRLYSAVRDSVSVEEILRKTKCKRYTMARIRRCLMYALLYMTKEGLPKKPSYIRALGFNARGREILRAARDSSALPVIMKSSDAKKIGGAVLTDFEKECFCDDIYALTDKKISVCGQNYTVNTVIL